LDDATVEVLKTMPKGMVRLEAGIQSVNKKALGEINRPAENTAALQKIKALRAGGNIEIHLDLIAGLPYELLPTSERGLTKPIFAAICSSSVF
jgi:coproporphyrinogen III oxidase-like Fe-S oxidoreductase